MAAVDGAAGGPQQLEEAARSGGGGAPAPADALAARLQALVCDTFDAPAVENDEAIARALSEEEDGTRAARARPPEDVSRDAALALACTLNEIAGAAGGLGGRTPRSSTPPEEAGAGLDAAVAAALGMLTALPWALGAAPPPPAPGGPGADAARLRLRLTTYGLEEGVVRGDGNCQARSRSEVPVALAAARSLRSAPACTRRARVLACTPARPQA
jgi:hypothetical protein